MQIKQSQIIQNAPVVLSPNDHLPDDLVGVEVDASISGDDIESASLLEESEQGDRIDEILPIEDTNPGIYIPQSFSIFSQRVNVGTDGRTTVDVIIEVEDHSGIREYELRVARDV